MKGRSSPWKLDSRSKFCSSERVRRAAAPGRCPAMVKDSMCRKGSPGRAVLSASGEASELVGHRLGPAPF